VPLRVAGCLGVFPASIAVLYGFFAHAAPCLTGERTRTQGGCRIDYRRVPWGTVRVDGEPFDRIERRGVLRRQPETGFPASLPGDLLSQAHAVTRFKTILAKV
jgi:hypothetical protein